MRELRRTNTFTVGTAIAPPGRTSPIVHILAGADLTEYDWHTCTLSRMLQAYSMTVGSGFLPA